MRRRQLLVTAGSVAAVGLCGCTDTSQSSDSGTDDTDSEADNDDADDGRDGGANSGDTTEENGGNTPPESVVKTYLIAKGDGDVETLRQVVHEDRQGAIDDSATFGDVTVNEVAEVTAEELATDNENVSAEQIRADAQSIATELNAEEFAIVEYDIDVRGSGQTGQEIVVSDGGTWQVVGEEPTSPPGVVVVEQYLAALGDGDQDRMRELVHPTDHDMIPDGGGETTVEEVSEVTPEGVIDVTERDTTEVTPADIRDGAEQLANAVNASGYILVYSRIGLSVGEIEQVNAVVQTDGNWLIRLEPIV